MSRGPRRSRGESGFALMTALLVILLLSIALALLAASLQIRMRLERDDAETVILSSLSDAAVAEALAHLAESAFFSGSYEHDFGGGRIASAVTSQGSPGLFDVVATATYGGHKRVVAAEVFRAPGVARVRRWRRLASESPSGSSG